MVVEFVDRGADSATQHKVVLAEWAPSWAQGEDATAAGARMGEAAGATRLTLVTTTPCHRMHRRCDGADAGETREMPIGRISPLAPTNAAADAAAAALKQSWEPHAPRRLAW